MRPCSLAVLLVCAACLRAGEPPAEPILRIETGFHTATIGRVDATADGRTLLSVSADKTVRLWRWDGARLEAEAVYRVPIGHGKEGTLYAGAISPDGRWVVAGGWSIDDSLYIIDRRSGRIARRVGGLPESVCHLRIAPGGDRVLATLFAGGVRCLGLPEGQELWRDEDYGEQSQGACWLPDGGCVTTCLDGQLRRYDASGRRQVRVEAPHGRRPMGVAQQGGRLILGYGDSTAVSLLDPATLAAPGGLDVSGIDRPGFCSVGAAHGRWWAGGGGWAGDDSPLCTWESVDAPRRPHPGAQSVILDLRPLPQGMLLGSADPSLRVVDAAGATLARREADICDMRGKTREAFRVDDGGRRLWFGRGVGGSEPVLLDLAAGALAPCAAGPADCRPPLHAAPGLDLRDWEGTSRPSLNGTPISLDRFEWANACAIPSDGRQVVLGCAWSLHGLAPDGSRLWALLMPNAVQGVHCPAKAPVAVAACSDGTLRWHRLSDGAELLACFAHRDGRRWVAWTPGGYYWAGPGGEELIGWHLNRGPDQLADFLPAARFADRFNRPDIVRAVLATWRTDADIAAELGASDSIAAAAAGVPQVRIIAPAGDATVPAGTERFTVEAEVTDTGGGIAEVRVLVNGKALDGAGRGLRPRGAVAACRWDIPVVAGENEVRITAFNAQRTESQPAVLRLSCPDRRPTTTLHGIAIAVGAYENPRYRLEWTVADAQAVMETVSRTGSRLFGKVAWTPLLDAQVTKANVQAAFAAVRAKAGPEDTLVVFYAGHGVMSEGSPAAPSTFYLVPPGVRQMYGHDDELAAQAISAQDLRDWCRAVPAQKQVLLFDACESGGAVEVIASRGAAEERALAQLSRSAGATVIAAAGAAQGANEVKALGHGIFTYALLEGLNGRARSGEGPVTLRGLDAWLGQEVPELTQRHRAQMQVPTSCHRGQDFPLALP